MQLERSYSRHLKVETYYLRALSQRSTCLFHHGNLLSKPVDPIFSMNFPEGRANIQIYSSNCLYINKQ